MKSAYEVLGVAPDASPEQIEQAFRAAEASLAGAGTPEARERLQFARQAGEVLRQPQLRAAHDRKLAALRAAPSLPRRPVAVAVADEPSPVARVTKIGLALLVIVLAAGGLVSWRNAQRREEAAAVEKAALEQRAREERQHRDEQAQAEAQRQSAAAKAEADERRLRLEGQAAFTRQTLVDARSQAIAAAVERNAAAEAARRQAQQAADDRRAAQEAQRRIAADKQRVRELCWQNYRQANC